MSKLTGSKYQADTKKLKKLQKELARRKKMVYYRRNPARWLIDRLGFSPESLKWSLYEEYEGHNWDDKDPNLITPNPLLRALNALANGKDVGIEAATGTGKTFMSAAIALWFVDCWPKITDGDSGEVLDPGGLVTTVATKQDQLREVLWKEIGNFRPQFDQIHPQAEWLDLKIRMSPDAEAGSKEGWGISGLTASVGSNEKVSTKFSGIHGPHMLFIMDEATGISPAILEAIENTCTGNHNLRLALGNPRSQNDPLHQFCLQDDVEHIRVSALDHPNVVLGEEVIPGAVTRRSIRRRMKKYKDPNHRIILSRVHGVSPSTSGMTLFPDDAIHRTKSHAHKGPIKHLRVRPPGEGDLRIYRKPKHDKLDRYVIFADVAGDRSKTGDYHAAVVLDRETREIAAVLHMRGPRTNYIGELMKLTDIYTIKYGKTGNRVYDEETNRFVPEKKKFKPLFAYERSGVGGLHMDTRIEEYENVYHQRKTDTQEDANERSTIGWDTNRQTRPDMIDALEEWGLELIDNPERLTDKTLWNEARTFTFDESDGKKGKWKAEQGCHDDVIMATAGALIVDSITRGHMTETSTFEDKTEEKSPVAQRFERQAEQNDGGWNSDLPSIAGDLP